MSKIRLHGSSSGYTEIAPVAASGNNTLTLPNDGTIISKDSAGAIGVTSVHTTNITATGIATITTAKIGAGVTISESGIEASGIGITVANINGGKIGGRRNIIINGAMLLAQRGTSSTSTDNGLNTLDRFRVTFGGTDEAVTQAQVSVASGTSPYAEGFRKSIRLTNGNQTSGAGSADYVRIGYGIEAQDIANSGWNYTSSSSFITISFWVKSSVAQSFKVEFYTDDSPQQNFSFDTGSLSADTWTKVIKTIPGNSNLTFNNDNGEGLYIRWLPFFGSDFSSSSYTEDTWAAYDGNNRIKDMTSTWYTTNDATFELTGVQLEVGPQATPFEHRSLAEELTLCQRYYYAAFPLNSNTTAICVNGPYTTSQSFGVIQFPTTMRAAPSGDITVTTDYVNLYTPEATGGRGCGNVQVQELTPNSSRIYFTTYASNFSSATGGSGYVMVANNNFKLCFQSEL